MNRRLWLANLGALGMTASLSLPTLAQGNSSPLLNLVVLVPPGGSVDLLGRLIAEHLPRTLQQTVVVENRPGASGSIAAASVARAAGDPNQLMLAFDSHVTNPLVFAQLPYTLNDFTPISRLVSFPLVFAVPASLPVSNIAEFITLARRRPGSLNVSSAGMGTLNHLAAELFKTRTRTHIVHIPYRGGVAALQAVMNNEVQMFMGSWVAIGPHVKSGRVKALAVTSARRYSVAPDIPTLIEAGVADFDVSTWIGALAPARIGAQRQQVLHTALMEALGQPAARQVLATQGLEWVGSTAAEFDLFIAAEGRRWSQLVRDLRLNLS